MNRLNSYKFQDLYEMSSGISSTPDQAGHGAPFLSFSTVFNNYFIPEELPDLMSISESEKEIYSIKEGDIFLTRTSETLDELGMSSVAIKDYPNASFSGFLKRLRPIQDDIVYHKYMAFYLRSHLFRKAMNNNAIMTLRASLNEQIFSYLNLLLPELTEQKKIGDFLFSINKKIQLNIRINEQLEDMAKTLYDYWFLQFDFPDNNGKPYKTSGGKMVWDAELKRRIPEGWHVGTLSDLGEIVGGSTPFRENENNFDVNGTPWITPKDLSENTGNKFITKGAVSVSENGIKSASLKLLPKGSVLMSSRAPVGYMAIARGPVTTNQGFKSFIPKQGFSTSYIFYAVKNAMPEIINNSSGSTFKEISGSSLKAIKISLPKNSIITKFTSEADVIFERQNLLELENQKLTELRDWLLPMLMNGQVKVN